MKKIIALWLLSLGVFAADLPHVEVAQQLAHGISTGDQLVIGNALAQLGSLACKGDPNASMLLGKKYFSGNEEFVADPFKAERYLKHAATHGVKGAALMLVMHYLKVEPTTENLKQAGIWMRVAQLDEGVDSPAFQIAKSAFEVSLIQNAEDRPDPEEVAKEGALRIHRIRNGLDSVNTGPCQG